MRKLLPWMALLVLAVTALGQNSRFEKTFRTSSGSLLTGATIYIVNQATNDSLQLTEHATRTGVYYRDNVPWGKYKIYVNGALVTQDYWHGTDRVRQFVEAVDPDGNNKIDTQGLEDAAITNSKLAVDAVTNAKMADNSVGTNQVIDSSITKPKLSAAVYQYIDASGGGTINNNPDDKTIHANTASQLYVDTTGTWLLPRVGRKVEGDPSLSGLDKVGTYKWLKDSVGWKRNDAKKLLWAINTGDTVLVGMTSTLGKVKTLLAEHQYHQPQFWVYRSLAVAPLSNGYSSLLVVNSLTNKFGYNRGVGQLIFAGIDSSNNVRPLVNMGIDAYHPLNSDSIPALFVLLALNNEDGSVTDRISYAIADGPTSGGGTVKKYQIGFNAMPPIENYSFTLEMPKSHPSTFTLLGLHREATSLDSTNDWIRFSATPNKYTVFIWQDSTSSNSTHALWWRSRKGQYDYLNGLGNKLQMQDNNNKLTWFHGGFTFTGNTVTISPGRTDWNNPTLYFYSNNSLITDATTYNPLMKLSNNYNADGVFAQIANYNASGVKNAAINFINSSQASHYSAIDFYTRGPYRGYSKTMRLDSLGNVLIYTDNSGITGTTNPGTFGGKLIFGPSYDPSSIGNVAGIYAKDVTGTTELFAIDGAGNITQLSPHDPETGKWIFYSVNVKTGRVLRIEMEDLMLDVAKYMSQITGKQYIYEEK